MEIKAKYTDANINTVRNYVSSKNSKVPILLLPVRIETRFMKVERPDASFVDSVLVGEILETFYNIEIGLLDYQKKLDIRLQKKLLTFFDSRVKEAIGKLKKTKKLTKEQKAWIVNAMREIIRESRKAGRNLNRLNMIRFQKSLRLLYKMVNGLDDSAVTKTADIKQFAGEMLTLEHKLSTFSSRNIPFTAKAKKRQLYDFVEGRIKEARDFYRYAPKKVMSLLHVEQNLVEKIKRLHKNNRTHLNNLPGNIKSLHEDENWKNFVDAQDAIIQNEYNRLFVIFEKQAIKHLQEMKRLDLVDANKVLEQSLAVKKAFEKFSRSVNTSYGEIKKFRKHLKSKINTLGKLEKKAIGGTLDQKKQITKILTEVETKRSNFERKFQRTSSTNNSRNFGLRTTGSFLQDISKVTSLDASAAKITTRKKVLEAQERAAIVSKKIRNLNRNQTETGSIGSKQQQQLDDILKDAELAVRKVLQFTDKDFHQLQSGFNNIKNNSRVARFETNTIKTNYLQKVEEIGRLLDKLKQEAIVTGEKPGIQFITPKKLKDELWLRIYPDDLFVHTHEERMTQNEIDSAKRYWKIAWAVNEDEALLKGAWRSLVASYGSNRAAWIVKTLGDLKSWKNNHVQHVNPSTAIANSLTHLDITYSELQKLKPGMSFGEIANTLELSKIQDNINKCVHIYRGLQEKPQLIYFLEKSVSLQQRIHSKFNSLIELMNKNLASNGQQLILEKLQSIFRSFEALHASFKVIKSMRTDEFLEHISDPYHYNNRRMLQPKEESWTKSPHTKLLPKQFVAVGRNRGQFEIIHVGKEIPDELQLGMNPETFNFEKEEDNPFQFDENGELQVEEGMRWMVDFDEAIKKGMGMIIPLTSEQAQKGFEELYVVGVNNEKASQDTIALEKMLENHHYAATGLEFLEIGTPTNNTEDASAGYSEEEPNADSSFALEMGSRQFNPETESKPYQTADGKHLADMLGVDSKYFTRIKNSGLNQIGESRAMHNSLWHATIGVYMEDMWDKVFTYDNIERTYQFFTGNVLGRGYLPSLRVGSQPYGILPVTSFKKISFSNSFSEDEMPGLSEAQLRNPNNNHVEKILQFRYDVRLKKLLNKGNTIWTNLRKNEVNHAGNIEEKEDPQAAFMNMLGLNATSTEFYFRYGVNVNDRTAANLESQGLNFKNEKEVIYSPNSLITKFYDLFQQGYFLPSYEWEDQLNPSTDLFKQITRQNARVKDQVQGSRIFTYRYLNRHSLVAGDLVSNEINKKPLPVIGDSKNYIQWLLDSSNHVFHDIFNNNNVRDIFGNNGDEEQPAPSVLFLLLRQSMLLSYREAAMNILQKDNFFKEPFRRLLGSKESYMSRNLYQFRTKWTHLLKRMEDIKDGFYFDFNEIEQKAFYKYLTQGARNESVSDYIHREEFRNNYSQGSRHSEYIARTKHVKKAMEHLANVPTKNLEQLLAEHLDVCSYRLDAWISGLANKRLDESRALQKEGIFLGAYAWVENLRPGGLRKEVGKLPEGFAGKDDNVYTDADNEGYIHAPSINHAISAAILRSGYLANDEAEGDLTNRMAVNLSSARVRKALQLINGLKNGLDLASVLGYQFEKGLHERYSEAEMDKFILPLRKKFPLIVPIEVTTEEANRATSNVVHGVNLLESVTDEIENEENNSQSSLYDYLTAHNFAKCPAWIKTFLNDHGNTDPIERNKELKALLRQIDEMSDAFDALGDLAISESVYQIVNGNHVRAASMLSALGDGKVLPQPQIIDTPRTGKLVTHKLILHFEDATGKPEKWNAQLTPRAKAEPAINHWLAAKIGDPETYFCQLSNEETGAVFQIQLKELPLQAIDLLFLVSSNRDQGNANLLDLIKHTLRNRENLDSEVVLKVDFKLKSGSWPKGSKSFYELDWLLRQCKAIIHDARPIDFSDIHIPVENPDVFNVGNYDFNDLKTRINQIHGDLKQFINLVKDFLDNNPTLQSNASFNTAYTHLIQATNYGITNLLAEFNEDKNEEASKILLDRLQKVLTLLGERNTEAIDLLEKSTSLISVTQKVQELLKTAKKILGSDFPFMPTFLNSSTNELKDQIELSSDKSILRYNNTDLPMEEWMQGIGNVRSKVYALEMLRMHTKDENELQPVQFPYLEEDYWLGMEFPDDYEAKEDKLSLILMNARAAYSNQKQRGLLIDEWVEIIPNKKETTGVTFQYDQPDAAPPQTMLLAVSPKPVTTTSKWEWDDLVYTLMDTFELARNRTVEPDQLEQSILGQVLPAVISEVVPPQLSSVFESDEETEVDKNLLGVQVVLDYESNLPKEES